MALTKKVKKTEKANSNSIIRRFPISIAFLYVSIIVVITCASLSPSLQNNFVNWDDPEYVLENPLVVNNSIQLKEIFTTPVSSNYHPLTILSLALNYQIGKLNPYGYHLVNLIFHLLNTILVFLFALLITRRNLLFACIVALFFGIHPMHVESVAWISERKDVLYVFFFMAGLITYLQYCTTKKTAWYIFTLLLLILSCLCKGMAVVFPIVLLLVDYYLAGNEKPSTTILEEGNTLNRSKNLQSLLKKLPFFIVAFVFGIIAYTIQSNDAAVTYKTNLFHRIMIASYGTVMYIIKFFIPFKQSAFYPYPTGETNQIPFVIYLFPWMLAGFVLIVYLFLRKERPVLFGLLFYITTIILVLQFISVGGASMADRYSYLSYIGLLFVVAYIIIKLWDRAGGALFSFKYLLAATIILTAIIFSFRTYSRTLVWKNSEALWTDVIDNYPDVLAYFMRGEYYQSINEDKKAIADYNMVTSTKPDGANQLFVQRSFGKRGLIYKKRKLYEDAEKDFTQAIAINSTNEIFYVYRAFCYDSSGNYDKAIADYNTYLQMKPKDDYIFNLRGLCFIKLNKLNEATTDFSQAIALKPFFPNYWLNRSLSNYFAGKKESAKADALKAQQLGMQVDPNYLEALNDN